MSRIDQIKQMLEEDPNDLFLLYALSIEEYHANNKEVAIRKLTQLIDKSPDYLASYYQLASWLKNERKNDECRLIVNKGIEVAIQQKNQKTLRELKEIINQLDFEDE